MSTPNLPAPARKSRPWALFAGLAALLWKAKWLLGLLKFGKFGGTVISMVVTVGFYATLFGWSFAVGFVLLIFVHEMGHAAMIKRHGIPAGAPVFIPLVGAAIVMKGQPADARVEAEVGIAGPVAGTVAALACWGIYQSTGSVFWAAMANVGFLLNLFNLLPISPLDGGRVAGAISKWLWVPGMLLLLAGIYLWGSPMLVLVLIMAALQLWNEFRRPSDDVAAYYDLSLGERMRMGGLYFGLVALLGYLSMVSHTALQQLR